MPVCRRIGLITMGLLLAAAGTDGVEHGLALFDQLEYDRAVVVLQRALTDPALPTADRRIGLERLAFAYVVLADPVNAARTFHRLLDLDPAYTVPNAESPRLRRAFADAMASHQAPVILETTVDDATVTTRLGAGTERVQRVLLDAADGAQVELTCEDAACAGPRPPSRFFVAALDGDGLEIARAGPYEGASAGGPPWWLWLVLGAAAAAGGVTAAVLLGADDQPPEGDLGRLALP